MACILVIEEDGRDHRPLREQIAQKGHGVVLTRGREESLDLLGEQGVEVVVLCAALPDPSVGPFVEEVKRRAGDHFLPVVLVGSIPDGTPPPPDLRYGADEVATSTEDLAALLPRIDALLERRRERAEIMHERERATERERLRDELTTLVVHDLKNPLAAILGNLDYALEEIPPTEGSLREALLDSKAAARRMLRLLANMLDVGRMETNRLTLHQRPVELQSLLGSVAKMRSSQAQSRAIELHVEVPTALAVVADEDILTRVVENILDNALRYTPRGGRIRFSGTAQSGRVCVRIGNNGPAVPAAMRETVFDKYAQGGQGKPMNLGLGMYFCRLAAAAHGGRIWIEEEQEFPTVFVLELSAAL